MGYVPGLRINKQISITSRIQLPKIQKNHRILLWSVSGLAAPAETAPPSLRLNLFVRAPRPGRYRYKLLQLADSLSEEIGA